MYENTIKLIGFVGHVDVFETEGKKPFAKIQLATTQRWLDKNGQTVEKTAWHTLHCFGKRALSIKDNIDKGAHVYVSGSLSYHKWPSDDSVTHRDAVIHVDSLYRLEAVKRSETASNTPAQ